MFSVSKKPLRILDFDIENRPLHYWYGDATTAEITVIAWSWVGEDHVHFGALDSPPLQLVTRDDMLRRFVGAYDQADIVTGHFIRGHDLPLINGALVEAGMPHLQSKLTSDTKLDLVKRKAMSVSQKNLTEMLGVPQPKLDMPQASWRDANRLTPSGIDLAVARCRQDVMQHKAMREELVKRNLLSEPKMWHPDSGGAATKYIP